MPIEDILDHSDDPSHRGRAARPTHAHEETHPLCGDVVRIELAVDDSDVVREAYFTGTGCRMSQAAASMLVEHVEGRTVDYVKQFSARDMLALIDVPLTPLRQRCCLLAWQCLQQAIYSPIEGNAEKRAANSAANGLLQSSSSGIGVA